MAYVLLGHRIANRAPDGSRPGRGSMAGIDQLGAAMLVAAVVATPVGFGGALPALSHPAWLLWGIGVGVCSSVIPYVCDQLAMARLPRATFALMLALLPVFATLIGAVVLHQVPTLRDLLGIGLVIAAIALHRSPDADLRGARMQYVRLGQSGLKVSRIGLGMMSYGDPAVQAWALAEDGAGPIVAQAAEAGVTFFDTADMYSDGASEEITGRLLRRIFARRDDYVLATKVFYPTGAGANDRGLSRRHILAGIDASLRRLGTDHVDLYQIHRWDDETPIEETMAALHDIVAAGKVRYLGASTMAAWQFAKAQHAARSAGRTRVRVDAEPLQPGQPGGGAGDDPAVPDLGVGIIPYSPLARGLLAGTRERGGTGAGRTARAGDEDRVYRPADLDVVDAVRAVAATRAVPPAQIALAWLLGRPGVAAPVIGATRPGHLDDALAAMELQLDRAEASQLEAPYAPHPPGGYT